MTDLRWWIGMTVCPLKRAQAALDVQTMALDDDEAFALPIRPCQRPRA